MVLATLSSCMKEGNTYKIGDFTYLMYYSSGPSVIKYNGNDSIIVLPTNVSYFWFHQYEIRDIISLGKNKNVHKVIIPDKYFDNYDSRIYSDAFEGCPNLSEIVTPNDINELNISSKTFELTKLGNAIYNKDKTRLLRAKDTVEFIVPSTVEYITSYAFANNNNLKRVYLPEGIQHIGHCAFSHCENLESVKLPSTLKQIDDNAFESCGLRSIKLPKGVQYVGSPFQDCENLVDIYIPSSMKEISSGTFSNCKNVRYVKLEDGIERIGRGLFYNCNYLQEVEIPESVIKIGENAFPESCYLYGNQKVINEYKLEQLKKRKRDAQSSASSSSNNSSYGPEWINGTWVGRFSMDVLGGVSYFTVRLEINQKTGKIRSIDVDNNQVDEGTYIVENGVIRARYPIAGGTTVTYDIDEQNRRIDYGDGHYLSKSSDTSSSIKQERTENIVFRTEQDVRNYLSKHSFVSNGGSKVRFQNNAYEMYFNGNCICTNLKVTHIESDGTAAIIHADGPYGTADYVVILDQPRNIFSMADKIAYFEAQ